MRRFLFGLALGALSGAVTYLLTKDPAITALVAAVAAVLTWLRIDTVIFEGGDG
ncbi:hypothetical protein ACIQU4_27445 [Streptomyces sp. NPDC090741]|uniref:hypothetical protein n=1 Tax=Streptomyces sp. NPDC090741 TaxID=3365967 RepID=UPI0037F29A76